MDWFLHNLIADLPGPQFLIVYGVTIVTVLAGAAIWLRLYRSSSDDLPPLAVPESPDPHEVAYLRGGPNELIRLVVFDLLQRNYLKHELTSGLLGFGRKDTIVAARVRQERENLGSLERDVFDRFVTPRDAASLFRGDLPELIEERCQTLRERLIEDRLLSSSERQSAGIVAGLAGVAAVLGLGGYKLAVAIAKGHSNVGFLLLLTAVAVVGLFLICRNPRVTRRGKRYLDDLRTAYERVQARAAIDATRSDEPAPEMALMFAVFGMTALSTTRYAYFRDMFARGDTSGTSSWGSCGGGSCGGGGCGGGGCGGGGCGGCGG